MASTEQPSSPQRQKPGFAAGSEGWDGSEDPSHPVASSDAAIRGEAGSDGSANAAQQQRSTQSDYALSRADDDESDDGRYSVAEEVSFDQQSDSARRVGQMPGDVGAAGLNGADPADGMSESMQQDQQRDDQQLKQSVERSVPPSP